MVDNFTRYTDAVMSQVSMHFQMEPSIRNRRTGRFTSGNFLPVLHNIIIETQHDFDGLFTDFSDAEKIYKAFSEYVRLVAAVNSYVEFMPTRANFCAFIGISTSMYARMLQTATQDIRDALCYVEDYFVALLQTGSLHGDVGSNAAKMVLATAGQYGHNLATVKEAADIKATQQRLKTAEELEADLKRLTSGK